MLKKRTFRFFILSIVLIFVVGMLPSFNCIVPVKGATASDWNKNSFWYYPWGKSVVHKGVDIFAKQGTEVLAATGGVVVSAGQNKYGGNYVLVLNSKWRLTYYAHLNQIKTNTLRMVNQGQTIGTVGTSGNAKGKSPHLHFSIFSLIPKFGNADSAVHGWKKMFYLNPISYF